MSRSESKLNSCATMNALSLKNNVRSMLRRNMAIMELHSTGEKLDAEERKKLRKETESMARHFTCILGILISFMTDEEICDFLDSWKHVIIDTPATLRRAQGPLIKFD